MTLTLDNLTTGSAQGGAGGNGGTGGRGDTGGVPTGYGNGGSGGIGGNGGTADGGGVYLVGGQLTLASTSPSGDTVTAGAAGVGGKGGQGAKGGMGGDAAGAGGSGGLGGNGSYGGDNGGNGNPGPVGALPQAGINSPDGAGGSPGSAGAANQPDFFSGGGALNTETVQLVVTIPPPSPVAVGATFGLAVTLEVSPSQIDTSFSGGVTLALAANAGSVTLGGNVTAFAQNGVATFTGLSIATAGNYAIVATSGSISASPAAIEVTSPVAPPTVTTTAATAVTKTGATLNASVNPKGSTTNVSFVYGTNSNLATGTTTTTAQSIGSGTSAQAVTAALTSVSPGTTFYFEVKATSAGGTTTGSILNFTTLANPAVLQFSSGPFTANVTAGSGQVVVTRVGNLSSSVTVVLSSSGGHEVAPFSRTITFGPNVSSSNVTIPIANDGRPGEANVAIPVSLSSPGVGAKLGAASSASLVIRDNNPLPPPVTIVSLQHPTIKVKTGTGKKAKTKSETVIELELSGALSGTTNVGAYMVLSGTTKKGATTFKAKVPLASAGFNLRDRNSDTLSHRQAEPVQARAIDRLRGTAHRQLRPPPERRQERRHHVQQ